MTDDAAPAGLANRPRALVAALVLLEGVTLCGAGCFLLAHLAFAGADQPGQVLSLAALALILGAGLAVCARGVLAGQRWTRGPVLTWQLLQAAVGLPLTTMGNWAVGVPLVVVALGVGVMIGGRRVVPARDVTDATD